MLLFNVNNYYGGENNVFPSFVERYFLYKREFEHYIFRKTAERQLHNAIAISKFAEKIFAMREIKSFAR